MDTPYKRLQYIADTYFKNFSQLSKKIGKERGFFSSYKNQKGFGSNILKELQDKLNINPKFIQYGDEPIFLDSEQSVLSGSTQLTNLRQVKLSDEDVKRLSQIRLYSISAQAYEAKTLFSFSDIPLSSIALSVGVHLDPEHFIAVHVSGFSMKDAGIQDGDIILVDTSKKELIDGKIYLLALNGHLMVKRIIRTGGKMTYCKSQKYITTILQH